MTVLAITDYIRLVQMNVARTRLALEQTRVVALGFDDRVLVDAIDSGLFTAEEVAALALQRRIATEARSEDGDDEFDKVADAAMRRLIKATRETRDWMDSTRHSLRADMRRLVAMHCPVGPGDIISQRYEEQFERSRAFVAALRGDFAHLVPIIECERKLQEVEATLEPYAEALAARRRVSAGDVRAAAAVMHEKTAIVVATIIAHYGGDAERMQAALLPIADQQARIRAILKARRAGNAVSDDPSRDDDDVLDVDAIDAAIDDEGLDGGADAPPAAAAGADAGPGEGAGGVDGPPARPPLGGNPAVNLPGFGADGDGQGSGDEG